MHRREFLAVSFLSVSSLLAAGRKKSGVPRQFIATAHSLEGKTASGTRSRPGTAAADPDVLPLGTRIRITGAGRYSGEYTIEDTGRAIKGNEIDLYIKNDAEAKRFGRQRVRVQIISKPSK